MFDEFAHSGFRDSSSTKDLYGISSSLLTNGRCIAFQEGDLPVNRDRTDQEKGWRHAIETLTHPASLLACSLYDL